MESFILQGFGLGLGITMGFIAAILSLILFFYFLNINKQPPFTSELFINYRDEILQDEDYEEANIITQIIEKLNKGEYPKKLLKNYELKKELDIVINPKSETSEQLSIKFTFKVIKKNKKKVTD